jgi:hypothetical protein
MQHHTNHKSVSPRPAAVRPVIGAIAAAVLALLPAMLAAAPSTQPATPAPATQQPALSQSTRSNNNTSNSNSNRSDRTSRRSRGNNYGYGNGGSVNSAAYSAATAITDQINALQTRSIFIKGNQSVAVADNTPRRTTPTGFGVGRPESSLVFNGVTVTDSETDALIEDTSSHKVSTVHPGDPIAGGKISAVTFDDLTYDVNGSSKHVAIGQNLDGIDAVYNDSGSTPSSTSSTGGPAPTSPAGGTAQAPGNTPPPAANAGIPIPSGASAEDILARMKARRAAEAAGK